MNKLLYLADRNNSKDNCSFSKTEIIIKAEDTGEVLFKGRNKVVLHGGMNTARAHFGSTLQLQNQAIDTILNNTMYKYDSDIEGVSSVPTDNGTEDSEGEIVRLFAVGSDGCGETGTDIYQVKYKDYIKFQDNPSNSGLVPFIRVPEDESLNSNGKYYGKKTKDGYTYYLFKAIESVSSNLVTTNGDNYNISNINNIPDVTDLEFYVSVLLKISKDECRALYNDFKNDNKRINSISLLTARKKTIGGVVHYYNIRPLTKLNFSNEYLIDPNKGIDITYNIYY